MLYRLHVLPLSPQRITELYQIESKNDTHTHLRARLGQKQQNMKSGPLQTSLAAARGTGHTVCVGVKPYAYGNEKYDHVLNQAPEGAKNPAALLRDTATK